MVSKDVKMVLFADDTNIFCSSSDLHSLTKVINSEMSKLKLWLDRNKLSLNLSKTRMILFGNHRTNMKLEILVDEINIERVNEIKFLGVMIDDKISWKSQIKHVQTKTQTHYSYGQN